jgi:hypothetical protein
VFLPEEDEEEIQEMTANHETFKRAEQIETLMSTGPAMDRVRMAELV